MQPVVYIVDDDPVQLALLTAQLERFRRFSTQGFTSPEEALEAVETEPPDGIVCDLVMPGMDGVELTRRVRQSYRGMPVIIATARSEVGDAERCLAAGATDFVTKPIDAAGLVTRIVRSLEETPARDLRPAADGDADPNQVIGSHPLVEEVRKFVRNVASAPHVSALLLGESGTGKSLVARAIHDAGHGLRSRLAEINCASLPAQVLEAELFGYEKGAFPEARQTKKGLLEVADSGTLFLDDVGKMPPEVQGKLLSFLEGRSFRRLGSTREMSANLRIVAASNVDLAAEVAAGRFRRDLYYRLNVVSHVLPPLRDVRTDIPALAHHFVVRAAGYFGKPVPALDPEDLERLQGYHWPGNARELRNLIERSMIFSRDSTLRVSAFIGSVGAPATAVIPIPKGLTLDEVERLYIESTLRDTGGNVQEAASRLGVSRKVLWQRRKRHGILEERS
ncbi:MAG TPA: sigma-54 dependent transcriptional regulator [Longimicrobiaceae bacterium]|nr:sigma-54 dependent transcriptional regulator [Longimicrobiaceae bacterium]